MNEFDAYILVDATGAYVVGNSEDACREKYEEDIGSLNDCDGFRTVRIAAKVKLPTIATVAVVVDGDEATVTA